MRVVVPMDWSSYEICPQIIATWPCSGGRPEATVLEDWITLASGEIFRLYS